MKKFSKILLVLLALVLTLTLLVACGNKPDNTDTSTDTSTDTETGTTTDTDTGKDTDTDTDTDPVVDPDAPVEIANVADLIEAANKIAENKDGYASKTFILTADITLTEDFEPITGFKGVFDGQFHTISGLVADKAAASIGLFDILDGAEVRNLIISGADISNTSADCSAGILAGTIKNSKIAFVSVDGKITAFGSRVVAGGLAGSIENSTVINTKSTVTVAGRGAKVGGLFGVMGNKAIVVNAYVDATITDKATVKGAAVGSKAADSAIAYVLVKSGDIAGEVLNESYLPNYIIACKTGVENAAQMGWNTVDWDVSGEVPALKTDADKNHTVTVKIDGKDVTASYGESISASLVIPADTDEYVAVIGYVLGSDFYYPALPVINDLTLTQKKIDYSSFIGTYVGLLAADGALIVDKNVVLGETEFTRVWLDSDNIYLKDSNGTVYSLGIVNGAAGYSEDACFIELKNLSDNSTKYFTVGINLVGGAWEKDGVVYIVDVAFDVYNGKTVLTVLNTTTGAFTYAVPYVNEDGDYVLDGFAGLNGLVLTINEETGDVSLKNAGAEFEMSVSAFNGTWVSKDGKLIEIKDGKYNGVALVPSYALMSTAVYVNGDEMLVFVACPDCILVADEDGNAVTYTSNDFGGEYVYVKDGNVLKLRIVGNDVYVNGSETPVTAVIGFSDGNSTLTVAVGETTYTFVKDGNTLVDSEKGVTMRSDKATEKFLDAVYVLGTDKFVFKDGKVTVGDTTLNLVFNYSGEKLVSLSAGGMTFAYGSDGDLTVKGYNSKLTGEGSTVTLFTEAEVNRFFNTIIASEFKAGNASSAPITFKVENGVFTINGVVYAYEFSRNGDTLKISFVHKDSNASNKISTFEPKGITARIGMMSCGNAIASDFYDAVGEYLDTFTSHEYKKLSFDTEGKLTFDGKTYTQSDYTITADGAKVTIAIVTEGVDPIIVTVENKVATVTAGESAATYYNYDSMLVKPTYRDNVEYAYVVIGFNKIAKIAFVKGYEGSWDDDDEEWYDENFPLYRFEYTIGDKTYSSDKYTWIRNADGSATITVNGKDDSNNEKTFIITYFDDTKASTVRFSVDGTSYDALSGDIISGYAKEYKNSTGSFEFTKDGLVKINGVAVEYTADFDFENGIAKFTVDDKIYKIDKARPEIVKCGDETFYDAKYVHFAGVKFIAFNEETGAFEQLIFELTKDGFKLNDTLVEWYNYNAFTFAVESGNEKIGWNAYSSQLQSYGFRITQSGVSYLDAKGDWAQRHFVPALIKEVAGAQRYVKVKDATSVIFKITEAYYDKGNRDFNSFEIVVGDLKFKCDDYSLSMDGTALVINLDASKSMRIEPTDDGYAIKYNGIESKEFVTPDLNDYIMSKNKIFASTLDIEMITIVKNDDGTFKWIYAEGKGYSEISDTTFSYGIWNDQTIVILPETKSFAGAVLFILDGKAWVISSKLYYIVSSDPLKDPAGNTVKLSFDTVTTGEGDSAVTELKLIAEVTKGETTTKVEASALNKNYDETGTNRPYVSYKVGDKEYAIVLNCDVNTKEDHRIVVMDIGEFNKCYGLNLSNGNIRFFPVYDPVSGCGKIGYSTFRITDEVITPVEGSDGVYTIVYKCDGKEYTDYIITISSGTVYGQAIKILSEAEYALLGKYTNNGITIDVLVGLYGDEKKIDLIAKLDGKNYQLSKVSDNNYKFIANGTIYFVTFKDGNATISTALESQYKFIGDVRTSGYFKHAKVEFVNGVYKVKMSDESYATDVAFAADNSYMTLKSGDNTYYIIYNESGYYHTALLSANEYALVNSTGALKATYSIDYTMLSLSVTYDGSAISLVYGDPNYFAKGSKIYVVTFGDEITVADSGIDLNSDEYKAENSIKGSYDYAKDDDYSLVISVRLIKDGEAYKAEFYATFKGDEGTLVIDNSKKIINVIVSGKNNYLVITSGMAYDVDAAYIPYLGTHTNLNGHTVTVTAAGNGRSGRYASTTYTFKVDDVSATGSKKTDSTGKAFFTIKTSTDYYLMYVDGDTKLLQSVTESEYSSVGSSKSAYPNGDSKKGLMYYKTIVTITETGFTFSATFGTNSAPAEVTLTDVAEGVQSFGEYNGVTYYYLTSGSSYYIVEKDFYESTYKTFTATNGTEFKFVWGSKILMIALKDGDDFGTAVEAVAASDGTHTYYSFTSGSVSYILAKNSADKWVLTDLSTISAPVHVKGYKSSSKVADLDNKAVFDSFELIMSIDDKGVPSYSFKFGNTVVSEFEELGGGEVIKVTLDGTVRYFAYASYYDPTSSSYDNGTYFMIELTAAQAGLVGQSATIDGVTYKFLIKGPYSVDSSWSTVDPTVYINGTGVKATFSDDGASITFTSSGTTYTATMVGGIFTVTEA